MKARIHIVVASLLLSACAYANGWMPPSEDLVAEGFDVYVNFDETRVSGQNLSVRDSVFRYIEERTVRKNLDKVGRFAVWRMIPWQVVVPSEIADKKGRVEILVENAPIATLPDTVRNENGDVQLLYSIWAKVAVYSFEEKLLFEKDYGLLSGYVTVPSDKKGEFTQSTSIIGINEVVAKARDDVYERYGFAMCKDASVCQVPESSKYYTFLQMVKLDMRYFVDALTYNDLIGQVFRLNMPHEFIQISGISPDVKSVDGTVISGGEIVGTYTTEYDNGRFQSFSGAIYTKGNDGKTEKTKLNKLTAKYDKKTGEYQGVTTTDGQFTRFVFPGYDKTTEWGVKSKQPNYCRTENLIGSFLKMKSETVETADVSVDLYGKVFVDGSTTSSLPFNLFKLIADYNSVKFPALTSQNYSNFHCEYTFNNDLVIVSRDWTGFLLLEKDRGEKEYTFIRMDDTVNNLVVDGVDENGNPTHFKRSASGFVSNNWKDGANVKVYDVFEEGHGSMSSSYDKKKGGLNVKYNGDSDIKISYDENGNVALYKAGDVEIIRKVNY